MPFATAAAVAAAAPQLDTATDAEEEGGAHCVCALIDNRAREVGVAVFDPCRMTMMLSQYVELGRSSAPITVSLLAACGVEEAVVLGTPGAGTCDGSALLQQLAPHLPERVARLPRAEFNDGRGRAALEVYCKADSWVRAQRWQGAPLYLAFAAAAALLHHLLQGGRRVLLAASLQLELAGTTAHMQLSPGVCLKLLELAWNTPSPHHRHTRAFLLHSGTLECLEILPPHHCGGAPAFVAAAASRGPPTRRVGTAPQQQLQGLSRPSNFRPQHASRSLYDAMNHTRTSVGARMLRASLVQPLTGVAALQLRHDAVQELLDRPQMALDVAQVWMVCWRVQAPTGGRSKFMVCS